jgi:hypothetical protein
MAPVNVNLLCGIHTTYIVNVLHTAKCLNRKFVRASDFSDLDCVESRYDDAPDELARRVVVDRLYNRLAVVIAGVDVEWRQL